MKIHHKGIQHEILSDAPFVGARILAPFCPFNCKGCFNKEAIRNLPSRYEPIEQIMKEVLSNPYNAGIILGGLEWSQSPTELDVLVQAALDSNLSVMIYTGMTEEQFKVLFDYLYQYPIWVKFGRFDESLLDDNYYSCGVKLASTNQYVKKLKEA